MVRNVQKKTWNINDNIILLNFSPSIFNPLRTLGHMHDTGMMSPFWFTISNNPNKLIPKVLNYMTVKEEKTKIEQRETIHSSCQKETTTPHSLAVNPPLAYLTPGQNTNKRRSVWQCFETDPAAHRRPPETLQNSSHGPSRVQNRANNWTKGHRKKKAISQNIFWIIN